MATITKENKFDIIVIGAGSGGLNVASFMNAAGFRVLLIDKNEASIGGDCLNFGCIPSKALIHVARQIYEGKQAEQFGFIQNGTLDIQKVMAYVRKAQETIREHENAEYFRDKGMTVVLGEASFCGRHEVIVNGEVYSAKKIVLATGSRPRNLVLPGIETATVYTNETIFLIDTLPKKLVFIGGGPISVELGQAFARLGSQVTIVSTGKRILERDDADIASVLMESLIKEGVTFYFETKPSGVERDMLTVETPTGTEQIQCDALFVGIGRELVIDTLSLEHADIRTDQSGKKLIVDDYLRTTNKDVYVCGDVAGGMMFTHMAEVHARIIITNFFSPIKKRFTTDHFAWVTYTDPEVATFGLSESELQRQKQKYEVIETSFADDDRAITEARQSGLVKLFIYDNKVLGGTMIGKGAGELVQELILAQTHGLSVSQMLEKVYPYPTATRINKKILGEYAKKSLTPFVKKLLHWMY